MILYIVLKLSHNNTIGIWFLPDFARWRWPRLSAHSGPGHAISILSPPASCMACPIKKSILIYIATIILFFHDAMKPFEVYAFDILSSNIILPLRWIDIIIVAILCPPYMYYIIYNFGIYLAHNSFNGFWQVVHHIFHVK